MFVDFSSISEHAKIWIYPSSRKFYDTETAEIENLIQNFIEYWKAEDENFKASYRFLYNRFINMMFYTYKDVITSVLLQKN